MMPLETQTLTAGQDFVQRLYCMIDRDPQAVTMLRRGKGRPPASEPLQRPYVLQCLPDGLSADDQIPYFVVATLVAHNWPQPDGKLQEDLFVAFRQYVLQHPESAPILETRLKLLFGQKTFQGLKRELKKVVQRLHGANMRIDFASLLDDLLALQDPNGDFYVKMDWALRYASSAPLDVTPAVQEIH